MMITSKIGNHTLTLQIFVYRFLSKINSEIIISHVINGLCECIIKYTNKLGEVVCLKIGFLKSSITMKEISNCQLNLFGLLVQLINKPLQL